VETAAWIAGLLLSAVVDVRVIQRFLAADVEPGTVASRTALIGTWVTEDGDGSVRLDPDGHFTATRLPTEVFDPGRRTDEGEAVTTAGGTWTFHHGNVELDAAGFPPDSFAGLGIARNWRDDTRLCVTSGDPGVLCDELLHHVGE
jgi:hypothetical protein